MELYALFFVSARKNKRHHHLQLQEMDNWGKPAATTWAAEFLLGDGESREFLGSWINSSAVHEAKKRRAKKVITCSFPCGNWLDMIGARASPRCELCKGERTMNRETTDVLPTETLAHIQSAGCKQKNSVVGTHNRCWKYLIGVISTYGESTRDLEFIGWDKDKQLEKLWAETKIGDILPWDEIPDESERLLESDQATRRAPDDNQANKEQLDNQEVDLDETDTHTKTIFGRRRQDSIAVEWNSKVLYVLEFKRTSDPCEITGSVGKPVHGLNTTSSSKASKRWQEKQLERIEDGKSN
jgi:hypothetical protein